MPSAARSAAALAGSALVATALLAGCGDGKDKTAAPTTTAVPASTTIAATTTTVGATPASVMATQVAMEHSGYGAALAGAKALDTAVKAFVAGPTEATLTAARTAWYDSRPAYLRTETFRFSDGPIDSDESNNFEGRLNAWPLDEVYIDDIITKAAKFPTLDAATLSAQNEKGGEKNIATGYHAVEYLLWGADTSATGPGTRPPTDYTTDKDAARRKQYLVAVTDLIVTDLSTLTDLWAPGGKAATEFLALKPEEGLRRILTGMGTLTGGELVPERIATAYESKEQEDEHSCFSDNTDVDHKQDEEGIQRAYRGLGADGTKAGPSIADLVLAADPTAAADIDKVLAEAKAKTDLIPRPFDQAILGADTAPGRVAIKAAIDALNAQTKAVEKAADALKVKISTEPK